MANEDDDNLQIKPASKSIKVNNVGAMFDFRTIVLQKTRKAEQLGTQTIPLVNKTKKNLFFNPEKEEMKIKKAEKNSEIQRNRMKKDEEDLRRREQRRKMEEKARLYDKLKRGEKIVYEDGTNPEFLVDFNRRSRSRSRSRSPITRQNNIGYNYEDADSKFVHNECEPGPSIPTQMEVFYNSRDEHDRIFGASHIHLPQQVDERQKKIDELLQASIKTAESRLKFKKQKTEERKAERAKINFMRQLEGKSPLTSEDEEELEKHPGENIDLNDIPLPPDPDEIAKKEEERKKKFVREWDKGKVRNIEWIQQQREVRDEEFRPPDSY